jgi:hypothetical protein
LLNRATPFVDMSRGNWKPRHKNQQQRIDSMTGVNPKHTHGFGLWNNPREVFSVRVDKGLKTAFTRVARLKFGSTCKAIEAYMAAVVGAFSNLEEVGVNPSITVQIGNMNIERNLAKERRHIHTKKTVVEETTETEVKETTYKTDLVKKFSMVLNQWELHPSEKWRSYWIGEADKYKDTIPEAAQILALRSVSKNG